ncbi:MAG: serine/threonine-protein kinase [Phycisphaerae bacterium]|nr:serine/threonine-protein kinase [Phycisphaerae bacterium]
MIPELFGYKLLARIGQGAASEIHLVQDQKTKQIWALKHVVRKTERDDRFVQQVEDEYSIGRRLDHPNLRATVEIFRKKKLFKTVEIGLLLEYVDAGSIDQRMPKNQLEAVRIFAQVARGLAHMHAKGFVHADMKPTNVMVTDDGTVKVIDLGQACAIGTVKKRIQGTPGYMAPEQAHREAIVPATDLYNFGATFYWVLIGEVIPTAMPPKEDQSGLYKGAIDRERIPLPIPPHEQNPAIHHLLSKQVMECIQLDPMARPASMERVATRLELIADLIANPVKDHIIQGDDETRSDT